MNRVKALLLVALLSACAAIGYLKSAQGLAPRGSGGATSEERDFDPTGSHPLPNESVRRGP